MTTSARRKSSGRMGSFTPRRKLFSTATTQSKSHSEPTLTNTVRRLTRFFHVSLPVRPPQTFSEWFTRSSVGGLARIQQAHSTVTRQSHPSFGHFGTSSTRKAATPNHALQPTATLAFRFRRPALTLTGSVTAGAPAMKPDTCRAFASRRFAHTRASGSRSLSLGSLGHLAP